MQVVDVVWYSALFPNIVYFQNVSCVFLRFLYRFWRETSVRTLTQTHANPAQAVTQTNNQTTEPSVCGVNEIHTSNRILFSGLMPVHSTHTCILERQEFNENKVKSNRLKIKGKHWNKRRIRCYACTIRMTLFGICCTFLFPFRSVIYILSFDSLFRSFHQFQRLARFGINYLQCENFWSKPRHFHAIWFSLGYHGFSMVVRCVGQCDCNANTSIKTRAFLLCLHPILVMCANRTGCSNRNR